MVPAHFPRGHSPHTLPLHQRHVGLLGLVDAIYADSLSIRVSGSRVASLKVPHVPTPLSDRSWSN